MKTWILMIILAVYLVYIIVGGLIFMVLESQNEEDTFTATGLFRETFLANNTCVSQEEFDAALRILYSAFQQGVKAVNDTSTVERTWTAQTSIYFATTVVTTIGYGNISPVTTGGRVFCVFFALFGIPLCLVVLGQIGSKLSKVMKKADDWLAKKMPGKCSKHPKLTQYIRLSLLNLCGLVLFILIPAALFMVNEEGWTYGDGVYYGFITLTTIGFGDYVAGFNSDWNHPIYRIMVAAWIILGLAWMSVLISTYQELLDDQVSKVDKESEKKDNNDNEKDTSELNETAKNNTTENGFSNEKYRKTEEI